MGLSVARPLRRRPRSALAATPARIFLRPALLASSLLAPWPGSRSPLLESTGSDTGPWRSPPPASLCPDKGPFPLPASFRSASARSRCSPDCVAWRRAPGGGPCRRLCGRKREAAGEARRGFPGAEPCCLLPGAAGVQAGAVRLRLHWTPVSPGWPGAEGRPPGRWCPACPLEPVLGCWQPARARGPGRFSAGACVLRLGARPFPLGAAPGPGAERQRWLQVSNSGSFKFEFIRRMETLS